MQTVDQRYAATAYQQVLEIEKEQDAKKYGSMAHKLPILIHTAGLAQALAFVDARSNSELQRRLLEHLKATIEPDHPKTLLQHAQAADIREYMRLTHQVLAALLWYKRFAQSILKVSSTEEDGNES